MKNAAIALKKVSMISALNVDVHGGIDHGKYRQDLGT
jgi:hypothetical protein